MIPSTCTRRSGLSRRLNELAPGTIAGRHAGGPPCGPPSAGGGGRGYSHRPRQVFSGRLPLRSPRGALCPPHARGAHDGHRAVPDAAQGRIANGPRPATVTAALRACGGDDRGKPRRDGSRAPHPGRARGILPTAQRIAANSATAAKKQRQLAAVRVEGYEKSLERGPVFL